MSSYEKKIIKLHKLKQLAEMGDENERQSAHEILHRLLDKYNISVDEIEKPDKKQRLFKYKGFDDAKIILCHTIWSVVHEANVMCHKSKKQVYADMDYSQYIEVLEKYKFYWCEYYKSKQNFINAFILKNDLYSPTAPLEKQTDDNKSDMIETARLMSTMNKKDFVSPKKMIETKNGG